MRSERLLEMALSPFEEAYRSVAGAIGTSEKPPAPARRTLFLAHEIDEYIALAFDSLIQDLCAADSADDDGDDIMVILNTPGGEDMAGFAIFDAIKAANESGNDVTAVVRGHAMSMGAIILQAAKTRRMSANSYLMIHQGWGLIFGNTGEVIRDAAWYKQVEAHCTRILATRSSLTAKEIDARILGGNWYLNAKDALKFGFVDEVI